MVKQKYEFQKYNYIFENPIHLTKFEYTHMHGIKQFIKKYIE